MARMQIDMVVKYKGQQALNTLNKDLNKTKSSLFTLKNVLLAVAGSVVLREFGRLSNEFQNLQNRLKLVTNTSHELAEVQNELFQISRRTRGGFSETVELYQKLALQAQNLKLKNEELLQITENVNKVIGIAGVDAVQASAGILQLSQAFASGRLQGDEFRSISENIPPLLDIFAKELGVTRGELKKLGSQGKITSEVIARSLLKETKNINVQFAQIAPTLGQSVTVLRNSFVNLVGHFNEVTGAADATSKAILKVADSLDELSKPTNVKKEMQDFFKIMHDLDLTIEEVEKKLGLFTIDFDERDKLRDQQKVVHEVAKDLSKIHKTTFDIKTYNRELHNNYKPHKTTVEKVLEKLKEHNREYEITDELFVSILDASKQFSRALAESLVLGKSLNMTFKELAQKILVEVVAKIIDRITLKTVEKVLDDYLFKKEQDKKKAIDEQNKSLKKQIALQSVLAMFGGGSGGFPGFAKGGAVSKGQPVVVGEKGPELFIPNQTGQITQNARGTGGGATTVNFNINTLDASGFDEMLIRNRGTITQIINNAVNERGKGSII